MQAVLSSGSSQSCPSLSLLGGRGMSWKTNCRHPTVLPRPTSAEFFRDCSLSHCALRTWVAFFLYFFPLSFLGVFFLFCFFFFFLIWAMIIAHRSIRSVRHHQHSALLWFWSNGGSRLRQCGPGADSSLNRQASRSLLSCSSDRRAVRAQQTADRATNMSGGEILFQGWLRKSPPEKKLRRYVSHWHFMFFVVVFFFSVNLLDWCKSNWIYSLSLFCWTRASVVVSDWD